MKPPDADVLVVGYGPVGQVLSTLLALYGRRVIVVEQQPKPFPLPRAVAVDGYAARVLAVAGVGKALAEIGEPTPEYIVENVAGQTLMRLELATLGRNGWPESTSMYQPGLEAALARRGSELETLRVMRGCRAIAIHQQGTGVTVTVGHNGSDAPIELTARWVVGCDGSNSTVRRYIDAPVHDLGFEVDWMACDVVAAQPGAFPSRTLHIADPDCPRVAVSAGPGHLRFEFMRLDGETMEAFASADGAWRRLAAFGVEPRNATLERFAVYRIRSRCFEEWRSGRLLVAGDAAHEMPPFAGQGLSSGIADAANLAWKLDAVLSGAAEWVLDTYCEERKPRVKRAIDISVRLGRVICTTDPAAAAARDRAMLRSAGRPAPGVSEALTRGFLQRASTGAPARFAGRLTPQARVATEGATAGLDQLAGSGRAWILLLRRDALDLIDDGLREQLTELGVEIVAVTPAGAGLAPNDHLELRDLDGVYLPWLDLLDGALGALVRPDFYVFGVCHDERGARSLVAELRARLAADADGDVAGITRAAAPTASGARPEAR